MGVKSEISNYDKTKNRMADVFLQYDQNIMISRFALAHDEHYLYLGFTGRNYRIHRQTGAVTWSEDSFQTEKAAGFHAVMTLYDILCYAKPHCHPANQWVNISTLSAIQGGTLLKGSNFFQNIGEGFSGKAEALSFACQALHGKQLPKGDVAYEISLFPPLSVILRFWEADEDFPASMQILVDKNILDYMHYETLMYAVSHLFERIQQICAEP